VTFYASADQLPPFDDYDMRGRTYRYFEGASVFPFGHGLSYTSFVYSDLEVPATVRAGEPVTVSVTVRNAGSRQGEEIVQLYLTDEEASGPRPIRSLQGFRRLSLRPGEQRRVTFVLTPAQLSLVASTGDRILEPGGFRVSVGGKQPGFSGVADATTTQVMLGRFEVVGETLRMGR